MNTNMRLGWKWLTLSKTLAYYDVEIITTVKSFTVRRTFDKDKMFGGNFLGNFSNLSFKFEGWLAEKCNWRLSNVIKLFWLSLIRMNQPGKPYRRGKISTVDLLVLTSSEQLFSIFILKLISICYKTILMRRSTVLLSLPFSKGSLKQLWVSVTGGNISLRYVLHLLFCKKIIMH
jgi:hypothetical protein